MSDSKWSEETEQAIFNELTAQFPHASTNEWVWAAQAIAHALADAGLLVTPSTSDSPRTWTLPTEPGLEVTALRDENGTIWRPRFDPVSESVMWSMQGVVWWGWLDLLVEHGPLTDATAEVQP